MRRPKTRLLSALLAVVMLLAMLTTTAFAYTDEGQKTDTTNGVLEFWDETSKPQGTGIQGAAAQGTATQRAGEPLSVGSEFSTRDLLYDRDTHKQFITVEGRDGNVFYIVIDYDSPVNEDEEQYTTYFLNKVDEADLLALIEQGDATPAVCSCTTKCSAGAVNTFCEICAVNMTECAGVEPEPVEPETPEEPGAEPEPDSGTGMMNSSVIVVLAVALVGGGAACFLKFKKKKPDVKGSADLDDYDYGDEDGEPDWDDGDTGRGPDPTVEDGDD